MGVLRVKPRIILLISILFAIAFASVVSSAMLPFTDRYYKDFNEGEEMTLDMVELDTLRFTYDGTNYSMRLLNIYSDYATIRVEMSAMDIQKNQPLEFDLDDDDEWDFNVELMFPDEDEAMFRLKLNEIEEEEPPEPPVENNTNLTNSTDTTNSTNTTDDSGTDDSDNTPADDTSDDDTGSENITTDTNSNTQTPDPDEITGDVVYNINIDIEIPPGSGIGVLLIVAIVLGGLYLYKKVRKKDRIDGSVPKKIHKNQPKIISPPVDRKAAVKKTVKKFIKNTRKSFKVGRQRFAGLIAGEEFIKNPKN